MEFSSIVSFLTTTGSSSSAMTAPAASKPFTTAFLLTWLGSMVYWVHVDRSAALQLGDLAPWLLSIEGMRLPLWMISWQVVSVLFGAALIEWFADGHKDWGYLYAQVRKAAVPGVGLVMQYGMVRGQAAEVLQILAVVLPPDVLTLGMGVPVAGTGGIPQDAAQLNEALGWLVTAVAGVWAVMMTVVTWLIARLRQSVMSLIELLDGHGTLGLVRAFSFLEGGFTITLMIVLALLPLVALALFGLTILSLWLIRRWLERREERSKIPCASCATPIYPSAPSCPSCRTPQEAPRQVGLFGQSKEAPVTNIGEHRVNLIGRKRCPTCATRLKERGVNQPCPACGTAVFADISAVNVYLRALDKRLVKTLLICGVLGLVPVVGLVPGIVYYRLSLIASLRSYIPSGAGCLANWGVRIMSMFLVVLQAFGLGFLSLPAMCLLNYTVYRSVLRSLALRNVPQAAPGSAALAPFGSALVPAGGMPVVPALPPAPARVPQAAPAPIAAPVVEPAPTGHVCATCGFRSPSVMRFCTQCGTAQLPVDGPPVTQAPPPAPAVHPCAACGFGLPSATKFCTQCGAAQ